MGKIILKQVLLKNYDIFLWIDFCIDHWNSYQNEIEKKKEMNLFQNVQSQYQSKKKKKKTEKLDIGSLN